MRLRNCCFTSYKLDADFVNWSSLPDNVRYLTYQSELCPSTGRSHLQGYIEFAGPVALGGIRTTLGDSSVHVERRRGSATQAAEYCRKASSRIEGPNATLGTISRQGNRGDLETACEIVRESGIAGLMEENPTAFIKYPRGFREYSFSHSIYSHKSRAVQVYVLWGPTGTGKTRAAHAYAQESGFSLQVFGRDLWFDGYSGQSTLILDEFCGSVCRLQLLLQLIDRYPVRLPIKGGHVWAEFDTVIITANYPPLQWYSAIFCNDEDHPTYRALRRRFTAVRHVSRDFPCTTREDFTSLLMAFAD